MTENEATGNSSTRKISIFASILKYLGAYLLGIVACILLTPVEFVLAGKALWPLYPVFAVIGFFLYYFYLTPTYVTGSAQSFWLLGAIGFMPLVYAAICICKRKAVLRSWRPLLIAFPIGFVGTLGGYYTAAASI